MTPEEFVRLFKQHKESLLKHYLTDPPTTSVGHRVQGLGLSTEQSEVMARILDEVLTDACYSILLALDGCASLAGVQQDYRIQAENGNVITTGATFDDFAWEYFHGPKAQRA